MDNLDQQIDSRIEKWKEKLIDISLKNRLLNFKITKSSTLGIEKPAIEELFRIMSADDAFVTAKFRELVEEEEGEEPEYEDIELRRGEILVDKDYKEGAKIINRIRLKANSSLEERGINVLYLAFGFCRWYDSISSDKQLMAPMVLVPVQVLRKSLNGPFQIIRFDDDITFNPAFIKKLEQLGVHMGSLSDYNFEDNGILPFLAQFSELIAQFKRWTISHEVYLSFFSYQKLDMYKDLETNADRIKKHAFLSGIAKGHYESDNGAFNDETDFLQEKINESAKSYQILDADSSQQAVIEYVKRGQDVIVQGPPGTGKSQTIVNMICELLGQGKKVLFVSEKQAALNVVKKRLDDNDLGIFCLELHSKKAAKSEVLKQLEERYLTNGYEANHNDATLPEKLNRIREYLNKNVNLFKRTFGHLNITVVDVYNHLIALKDVKEVKADIETYDQLSVSDLDVIKESLDNLTDQDIENIDKLPLLKKLKFKSNDTEKQEGLRELSSDLLALIEKYKSIYSKQKFEKWHTLKEQLITLINTNKTITLGDNHVNVIEKKISSLKKIDNDMKTIFSNQDWQQCGLYNDIIDTVQKQTEVLAASIKNLYKQFGTDYLFSYKDELLEICAFFKRFNSNILYCDFHKQLLKWEHSYTSLFGRLFGGYRKNRKKIFSLSRDIDLKEAEISQVLRKAKKYRQEFAIKNALDDAAIFKLVNDIPDLFHQIETSTEKLNNAYQTIVETMKNKILKTLNATVKENTPESPDENLEDWRLKMNTAVDDLLNLKGNFDEYVFTGHLIGEDTDIDTFKAEVEDIRGLLSFQKSLEMISRKLEILEQYQLTHFLPLFKENEIPSEFFSDSFLKTFYKKYLNKINMEAEAIYYFSSEEYEEKRKIFAKLDFEQLQYNKKKLVEKNLQATFYKPFKQDGSNDVSILLREIKKKRRKLPIRKLFQQIPTLVQQLKPCMLMSPLSVSHFLEASSIHFDTVIFDEASQVFPEDSVGSIMRAEQVVIVGDDKQLPPTDFFKAKDDEDTDTSEDAAYQMESLESVLDESLASSVPSKLLEWHYRSRDESLIAFSNHHFYDNRLITFPSNNDDSKDLGVAFEYVEDGWYDRGKSRKNIVEAKRVCELIFDFARQYSDKSLGVITFNERQREAIYERLEWMRKQDPSFEGFFKEDRFEPFFVKNLENVQGDERDVIMFSVGYAKDRAGRMYQNFGPINQNGGERRLNVAVTRAREKVIIVSSITYRDIPADKKHGVYILREYLRYAENNGNSKSFSESVVAPSDTYFDSPFEEDVYNALIKQGYQVDTQVGASGYKIDLAIRNPQRQGSYVLAIECDGASFHSSRTARDRDRLRQSVLEDLGWKIVRIWSKDWFNNPDKVLEKIVEKIENEKEKEDNDSYEDENEQEELEITYIRDDVDNSKLFEPYRFYSNENLVKNVYHNNNIQHLIHDILKLEAPMHINEMIRRLRDLKIYAEKDTMDRVVLFESILTEKGSISRKKVNNLLKGLWGYYIIDNDFILIKDQKIVPRMRTPETKIDFYYIHPEEICEFIKTICSYSNGIDRDSLVFEVLKNLGFKKTGQNMSKALEYLIDHLLEQSVLIKKSGELFSC